jgi:exodeoxyribonuclease VII large subunit
MTLPLTPDVPLTVSQVTRAAKRSIEAKLGALWVRGEIAEIKIYQSGHWYFTLKDAESQMRGVLWRTHALRAGPPPAVGAQVFVFAVPTIWEERGEFRLNATELLATDRLGQQHLELERVRAALHRDGLFDAARKRVLPTYPAVIAVITSIDGAALRDIVTVARKRWRTVEVRLIAAKVQGAEAEVEVVRALSLVNRLEGVDICILARGGGGREDLAVFNSERVCRALAKVRVPTISAVGHETDISLTDLVADWRAATPSAAAELAVPDSAEVADRVNGLAVRLAQALGQGTRMAAERLERSGDRLHTSVAQLLERRNRQVERLGAQLDALSPLRVLERGFALPRREDGHVLRLLAEFESGMAFRLRIQDGEVGARVERN